MDSLIFALSAVAPIILMVALGYLLKRIGWLNDAFCRLTNKLVFRLFLPAMLFLNVYKIESFGGTDFGYMLYTIIGVTVVFLVSLPLVMLVTKKNERRGPLLQVTFRSNHSLIGIPLAESLYGEAGVAVASLLSAAIIPLFNALAVISLSIFRRGGGRPSLKHILLTIVKNPLIQSVLAGIAMLGIRAIFLKNGIAFRLTDVKPIFSVLTYLSNAATPLSLLVLGAQFEFSEIKECRKEIIFGTLVRTVFVPTLLLGIAYIFFSSRFTGAHFATFISIFATPAAASSVAMVQEMDGDSALAGQLVVWTTIFSAVSIFVASFLLRMAGIL